MDDDRKPRRNVYIVVPVDKAFVLVLVGVAAVLVLKGALNLYLENVALKAMLGLH